MDNPRVEVRDTEGHGKGLFAREAIKKDAVIAEFDGDIYEYDYADWTDELADHVIQFERKKWRDSKGIARYSNHSCEPNCGIKGLFQIVAMREIMPSEELTWDYDMSEDNYHWDMECRCGAATCRKKIGAFRNLPLEHRERYRGYISEWLVKEYGL
jgi:SET domain-containing protein